MAKRFKICHRLENWYPGTQDIQRKSLPKGGMMLAIIIGLLLQVILNESDA
jgi:hypothetical protein